GGAGTAGDQNRAAGAVRGGAVAALAIGRIDHPRGNEGGRGSVARGRSAGGQRVRPGGAGGADQRDQRRRAGRGTGGTVFCPARVSTFWILRRDAAPVVAAAGGWISSHGGRGGSGCARPVVAGNAGRRRAVAQG